MIERNSRGDVAIWNGFRGVNRPRLRTLVCFVMFGFLIGNVKERKNLDNHIVDTFHNENHEVHSNR